MDWENEVSKMFIYISYKLNCAWKHTTEWNYQNPYNTDHQINQSQHM